MTLFEGQNILDIKGLQLLYLMPSMDKQVINYFTAWEPCPNFKWLPTQMKG